MELAVYNLAGKETGRKVSLKDDLFASEPNDHAIWLDVKQFLANNRQGTSKTKQRNEVHGSTRKLHKQKGTGGSRKGSIKNPLFRDGGRIFGPQPRDYHFKLNKKLKRVARRSAISYVVKQERLTVVEDFNFEAPKTKAFVSFLKSFNVDNKKVLLVLPDAVGNVYLSSRNIPSANVISASELNTYEVMDAERVIMAESTLPVVENLLSF
jgi:large subunit ribosomal protein L4